MKKLDFPLQREFRRNSGSSVNPVLDFHVYTDATYWTKVLTGSGTVALGTLHWVVHGGYFVGQRSARIHGYGHAE